MTLPARDTPGTLGTLGFTGAGSDEFRDYRPRDGHTVSVYFVRATVNGNADFIRVAQDGSEQVIAPGVAVTAGTELIQQIQHPVNQIRVRYTAVGVGTATCEALDGGMA